VTPGRREEAEPLLARLRKQFAPNRVLMVLAQADVASHAKWIPLVEGKAALKGRPTAYVCEKRVCELPTGDPEVFARQVAKVERLERE
jgi:hypothetical protein